MKISGRLSFIRLLNYRKFKQFRIMPSEVKIKFVELNYEISIFLMLQT